MNLESQNYDIPETISLITRPNRYQMDKCLTTKTIGELETPPEPESLGMKDQLGFEEADVIHDPPTDSE